MKVRAFITAVLATLACASFSRALEPMSDELKVLGRFLGTWEESVVYKPAAWTPQRTTSTLSSTWRWILNSRMLENKGTSSPGEREFLQLMTYDPQRQIYLQWFFDQDNPAAQTSRGTWDESTQSFTFAGTMPDGIQTTSVQRFLDDDKFTWTFVAKDASGKVVLDVEATCVRRE